MLTLDLGSNYHLDAIQVISSSKSVASCSAMFSLYLSGLEIFVSPSLDPLSFRKCSDTSVPPFHHSVGKNNELLTEIPQVGLNTKCFDEGSN